MKKFLFIGRSASPQSLWLGSTLPAPICRDPHADACLPEDRQLPDPVAHFSRSAGHRKPALAAAHPAGRRALLAAGDRRSPYAAGRAPAGIRHVHRCFRGTRRTRLCPERTGGAIPGLLPAHPRSGAGTPVGRPVPVPRIVRKRLTLPCFRLYPGRGLFTFVGKKPR